KSAVFNAFGSQPAMDGPALDSYGQFAQFLDFKFISDLWHKGSEQLAFIRCYFYGAKQRAFHLASHELFEFRNQVEPDAVTNHLPAHIGGVFAEFEMERPDKFENLILPNFEQRPADQQISSPHNDMGFRFNGSVIERSRSTEQIEQESLYLVISMVCEKERRSRILIRS